MWFLILLAVLATGFLISMVARFKEGYRKPLIVAYLVLATFYVAWRVTYTIPTSGAWNIAFGVGFLLLEIIAIIQTVGFAMLFWETAEPRRAPEIPAQEVPTVDVYIATYNEPVDIVEATVVAATQLDYPRDRFNVYICDDGDRPFMRELARKWSVGYIRRDDHEGAKAGNLNHALQHTRGEFIVTMDADMVLKPQFLRRTLGHFQNHNVAFVQVPQAFHNEDVFQNNLFGEHTMRNDQDFFMRFIEPQRDKFNATIYIGSGAIFRRSALAQVGGFVTDVITEDMATGLLLQNAGFESVYVNEVLATGLAAETYADLLKQRIRWGRGNIQVAKKYGPRRLRNLSFAQKWLLLDSVHFWFFGIYRMAFLLLPMIVLSSGIELLRGELSHFLMLWATQFMYSRFIYDAVTKGRFKTVWTSIYELAQAPQIAVAVLQEAIFGNNIGFQVTSKGREAGHARFAWEKAWPQLLLFLASLGVLAWSGYTVYLNGWLALLPIAIPLGWLLFNTLCLLGALAAAVDQPRHRHRLSAYQAPGTLEVDGQEMPVQVEALHTEKICFSLPSSRLESLVEAKKVTLVLNDFEPVNLRLEYAESDPQTAFVFALYDELSKANYAQLVRLLNFLNTQRFRTRPSARRVGVWDASVGLLLRATLTPDRIMGRGRRELLQISA
ncbi:MAG: glycosyltransferase [Actinomycetaceae bacterium]|nr:glycosyltransferase [Actinomycetaceae bacterium]